MEQAAVAFSDLLDGKDKPVVGSTCEFKEGQLRDVPHLHHVLHQTALRLSLATFLLF